jgi:2-oxoglutarate ferredoxin oxidoreductase subunit delta
MVTGTVIIATEICKGCELCIAACPQKSLALSSSINRKGYRFAELVLDNCTGCINCALVCPDSAITVYRQAKPAKRASSPSLSAQTA